MCDSSASAVDGQLTPKVVPSQGIWASTGTETFAKEPKLAKLLRELKLTPMAVPSKKPSGFTHMSENLNLPCFGALLWNNW